MFSMKMIINLLIINSWGPMILGHAYAPVVEAVKKMADSGTSFGMPTVIETKIAGWLVKWFQILTKFVL